MTGSTDRTLDAALDRFELVGGTTGAEDKGTACAMTLLSWVAGDPWSDHPPCAHPTIASIVVAANDHDATTPEDRVALVRAGEAGVLDTWWVPGPVVAWCVAQAKDASGPLDRALKVLAAVTKWKEHRDRPDLQGADLRGAYLRLADLQGADLRGAYLQGADLRGAYLQGADLRRADLQGADLRGAYLRGADLRGAYLRGADLRGADLQGARLLADQPVPAGWVRNELGLLVPATAEEES